MNSAALRGRLTVDQYISNGYGSQDDLETAAADLVADLQIWMAAGGIDWDEVLRRADTYVADPDTCHSCNDDTEALDDQQRCPSCAT
ncbi:hypothetical protein [Streptomyces anulatus]|uniref:hypothetical protein n=1 Tax=Streptomyces anulatus TaxID=1892 RepID=UPI001C26A08B|nr:hypothetical protein [Streptomyces anulatus]